MENSSMEHTSVLFNCMFPHINEKYPFYIEKEINILMNCKLYKTKTRFFYVIHKYKIFHKKKQKKKPQKYFE